MDAVEIVLFSVVGVSVLAFLIIGYLEGRRKPCCESGNNISDYEEEEKRVGGDGGAEEQLTFEDFKRAEIVGEEEKGGGNRVSSSCEKLGTYDISENCGVRDEEFMDDWEGIERTELEKVFGEALVFISDYDDHQIHEDVKLQFYGLSRIALEGPCFESQPLPLKVSARAKWDAWQKLGNMSREMAMEKYIDILSKAIPSWKVDSQVQN